MKKIILKSLTLTNWRGEKQRTTEFNPAETTIMGDNGLGKTRHFDAFIWLLFGKDTQDRKDHNIKTIANGEPLQRADSSVCGVFDVDGETVTLLRIYKEKWVKKRGRAEEEFEGHEHVLFWNDVPLKLSEYNARVSGLIDDSIFKMITNPFSFARMDWKIQREQLFQLAGTITDSEIALQKPEYAALLDKISGKSFDDFKREIAARKRKLKDELITIQPRIDQTHKLTPEKVDFVALESEIADLDKQIAEIEKAISDKSTAVRQQNEAEQKKQAEINKLKRERQKILFDAQTKVREDAYTANAERREAENSISVAEAEIVILERAISSNLQYSGELKVRIANKTAKAGDLRKTWFDENAKEYKEENNFLHCPVFNIKCTCEQAISLHSENAEKGRLTFYENKKNKLAEITTEGKRIVEQIEEIEKSIEESIEKNKDLNVKIQEQTATLNSLKKKLDGMKTQNAKEVNPEELPEYVGISKSIAEIESTLIPEPKEVDTIELQAQKKEFAGKRDVAKSELQKRDLITKYTQEIADLTTKSKTLAQQIADAEREEYAVQQFAKAKINECEKRINGLFSFVRFKLFDYTIEGNEFETCIPLVDGIPFDTANTANKVNAGLDIINALCRFYGVCAPIFIDNRESVNQLIKTESQIINLVVSHDKQLIIK
jgi:peptidoglycan hydrolase CwlO-like protein